MRCFVALTPPAEVREALAQLTRQALRTEFGVSFRAVRAEGIHLTCLFLGELSEREALALGATLSDRFEGAPRPFLKIEGVGAFPSPGRARVLWAGVRQQSGSALQLIHEEVSQAALGEREQNFRPHLTLARLKGAGRPAPMPPGFASLAPSLDWRVEAIELMRSHLGREGARYECLRRVEFSDSSDSSCNPRS